MDPLGALKDLAYLLPFQGFFGLDYRAGDAVPHGEDRVVDLLIEKGLDGIPGGHERDEFRILPVHLAAEFERHGLGVGEGDAHVSYSDPVNHDVSPGRHTQRGFYGCCRVKGCLELSYCITLIFYRK